MDLGQSTYQQGESFHWDKKVNLIKKRKKGSLSTPYEIIKWEE